MTHQWRIDFRFYSGLLLALLLAPALAAQRRPLPTPASVLGFEPGADRKLPTWKQVTDYFTALDRASPRVSVRTLGKTTLGRPFLVAFIADSATLVNPERYRTIQRKLADPRLRTPNELPRLIADGKNVILITSSIHSTEVGGFLTPLVLADRLARGETAEAREILANTIVMLVPSLNPDGVDIVGDWYRATVGTPSEGNGPPALYHHYTGHDNNRDWYAFTQVETRYTIDSLYTPWTPQIVNDIHQQGPNGGRIFIPPYMDPVEPNIDPILTAGATSLGMAMSWRMLGEGKTGVATNASYDQWSPARQYSFNHRGVRILTETASARLATPLEVPFSALGTARGYDARVTSWNFPALWPGGTWTVGNIVDYQTSASWALLAEAARDRRAWLTSYAALGDRALAEHHPWRPGTDVPAAYLIPKAQPDAQALARLLWTLQHGQVEIRESDGPATAGGKEYPAGSYLVPTRQMFGSYANALLERQRYPNLREYPGGPPKAPYDVTAHTLPLLFGVEIAAVTGPMPAAGNPIAAVAEPAYRVPGLSERAGKRIGLYRSYSASMDEGWTRWMLDVNKIGYQSVVDRDIRAGGLNAKFDVIIVPDQSVGQLTRGLGNSYPDSRRGGLGADGAKGLREFAESGGTILFFNEASEYAIEALGLPVRNVLAGVRQSDFYAPGSLLGVEVDRAHPIAAGFSAPVPAVWFEDSPTFEATDPARVTVVARYQAAGDPLLSGWLLGGDKLNGKAALVEVAVGKGRAVLYGFRPQYRGQTMATQPLIWGAIGRGATP
ncbi:MAG: peptidase M14 [Gemmatimonadales bacterium]|nr:peptidase M14 [Gemmatimonadales bacterium]